MATALLESQASAVTGILRNPVPAQTELSLAWLCAARCCCFAWFCAWAWSIWFWISCCVAGFSTQVGFGVSGTNPTGQYGSSEELEPPLEALLLPPPLVPLLE